MTGAGHGAAETIAGLRAWARGAYDQEAAVELLVRAFDGRFARPGHAWIVTAARADRCAVRLDATRLAEAASSGPYSGGERRLLAIVASLAGACPVVLAEVIPGLDRTIAALVLAAIAYANGSHEHSDLVLNPDTGKGRIVRLPGLYPWPTPAGEVHPRAGGGR